MPICAPMPHSVRLIVALIAKGMPENRAVQRVARLLRVSEESLWEVFIVR